MTFTVFSMRGFTSRLPMATSDVMEFSKKLRTLAGKHRYSQEMLARALNVSQSTVSNWTRGMSAPGLYEAARLAELFGVDVNFLADDSLDVPLPSIGPDEEALIQLYRALGIEAGEALRRLAGSSGTPKPVTERIVGVRDETEYEIRRQREILAKVAAEKRAGRAKSKRAIKVDRDHEGSDVK